MRQHDGSKTRALLRGAALMSALPMLAGPLAGLAGAAEPQPFSVRVNAGGKAVTTGGAAWAADAGFAGGKVAWNSAPIAGTTDDVVYRSERRGMTSYEVAVPAKGTYTVELHMAETYHGAKGRRVFSAKAEGSTVVKDLDLFATVGKNRAHVVKKDVVVGDGELTLTFSATRANAVVNGIVVTAKDVAAPAPAPEQPQPPAPEVPEQPEVPAQPAPEVPEQPEVPAQPAPEVPEQPEQPRSGSTRSGIAFPGPGTVGHLADVPGHNVPATDLKKVSGSVTSTRDGEVIEGLEVTGDIIVRHSDVIVRRNRIHGVAKAEGGKALFAWNTIGKVQGDEDRVSGGGRGRNATFFRNEIFGSVDLFNFYDSGNVTIEENWAYSPYQQLTDEYQMKNSSPKSHNDGIQVHKGGSKYEVVNNRFDLFLFRGYRWSGAERTSTEVRLSPVPVAKDAVGVFPAASPMTSGFLFQNSNGRIDDVLIQGNHFDGDVYRYLSFNKARESSGPTNVRVLDNTFVKRYPNFGKSQLIGADTPGNITWGGNVDQKGTTIPKLSGMKTP